MINEDTHSKLMAIKQSFRLFMDGTTSRSMAQKGIGYKINWGVPFHELRKMAAPYTPDYELAIELWKENIRECKIMATLIRPNWLMCGRICLYSKNWPKCWPSTCCNMLILHPHWPISGWLATE